MDAQWVRFHSPPPLFFVSLAPPVSPLLQVHSLRSRLAESLVSRRLLAWNTLGFHRSSSKTPPPPFSYDSRYILPMPRSSFPAAEQRSLFSPATTRVSLPSPFRVPPLPTEIPLTFPLGERNSAQTLSPLHQQSHSAQPPCSFPSVARLVSLSASYTPQMLGPPHTFKQASMIAK